MSANPEKNIEGNGPLVTIIQPPHGWVPLKLRELYEYRELLYFLTWRDIKVRYKQTILGILWAILQPVFTMVVFTVIIGLIKGQKAPIDGLPAPIFIFAALVPWTLFQHGLNRAANSLVSSSNLLKKVYFPRLALPIATLLSSVVDFTLAFLVLIILMIFFGIVPTINIIWLPLFLMLAVVTSLGVSFWLAALNVQFRDIRHALPFIAQTWFFITPIVYSSSAIENPIFRALYGINPMTGVVEGFRWALLGTNTAPGPIIIVSTLMAIGLFVGGAYYFRRMEKTFADVV